MTENFLNKLREIQSDYFKIYDDIFGVDIKQASEMSDKESIEFVTKRIAEGSLCLVNRGVKLSTFEYKILSFTQSITEFWNGHYKWISENLQHVSSNRVQFPYGQFLDTIDRDVKKLTSYFDTVVILDDFLYWGDHLDLRDNFVRRELTVNFRKAAIIYKISKIAQADVDIPLAIILPSFAQRNQSLSNSYSMSFVNAIFGDTFQDYDTAIEASTKINAGNVDQFLNIAKQSELFNRAIIDFDITPLSRAMIDYATGKVTTIYGHFKDFTPDIMMKIFMSNVHTWFSTYCNSQQCASVFGNDIVVGQRMWELHKWHLEKTAIANFSKYAFSQEELSALTVLHPKIDFLGDITLEELLELRANNGAEEIRSIIKKEQHIIRTMTLEDFTSSAQKAAVRLLEAISEYETMMQRKISEERARKGRLTLELGFAVALGVGSVAVPVLGIPATAISLIIGTQSIRTAINDHLAGKRELNEFARRPIGLLYQVYKRKS